MILSPLRDVGKERSGNQRYQDNSEARCDKTPETNREPREGTFHPRTTLQSGHDVVVPSYRI